ncbi:MAG: hypothetical protein M3548_22420 [Actinomycetota bacterium]|nr:hypothetical protein [Actinomycetota bacterium]
MSALVLACGNTDTTGCPPALTERDDVEVHEVGPLPGKARVDPLLKAVAGRRAVVFGTDADLAAVVLRIMRTDRLADVAVGFVPADPARSAIPRLWGLPTDQGRLVEVALGGEVDPFPLIRDDAGGVLVGLGVLRRIGGVAYCDDTTVLRGRAARVEITPDPEGRDGLVVRVVTTGLFGKRVKAFHGRAFQIGCLPVIPSLDGIDYARDVSRWTWYRHTADLRVARGVL